MLVHTILFYKSNLKQIDWHPRNIATSKDDNNSDEDSCNALISFEPVGLDTDGFPAGLRTIAFPAGLHTDASPAGLHADASHAGLGKHMIDVTIEDTEEE